MSQELCIDPCTSHTIQPKVDEKCVTECTSYLWWANMFYKVSFWANMVLALNATVALTYICATKRYKQAFIVLSLLLLLLSAILCSVDSIIVHMNGHQSERHQVANPDDYVYLWHGIGNILLLWFHLVIAQQYYRAFLNFQVAFAEPDDPNYLRLLAEVDSLDQEEEKREKFVEAFRVHEAGCNKRIARNNICCNLLHFVPVPFLALIFVLLNAFLWNAQNFVNWVTAVLGFLIVGIFLVALCKIRGLVKKNLQQSVYKDWMLVLHLISLFLFFAAAVTMGCYFVAIHKRFQFRYSYQNYPDYELACKLCIMNTVVNVVTSTFAILVLLLISVDEGSSKQQDYARLFQARSLRDIRNTQTMSEEERRAAVYNHHTEQVIRMYVSRFMQPPSSRQSSASSLSGRQPDVFMDQGIFGLFTATSRQSSERDIPRSENDSDQRLLGQGDPAREAESAENDQGQHLLITENE